jgi:GNAT superfamily N-acetyltransferase
MKADTIRKSKNTDLPAIHSWLQEEERLGVSNFLCNWEIIRDSHSKGQLTVYVDGRTAVPVAFQLGGLIHPGILEVRRDMRRKGIGRKLVAHCVAEARENNENFLIIECKPSASIPFWQAMGFTLFGDQTRRKFAFRALRKVHRLPSGGRETEVVIRFYPEKRIWRGGEAVLPTEVVSTAGLVMSEGMVHLKQRAAFCKKIHDETGDIVIEIIAGGECWYLGKAKYPEAKVLGVQRCSNGFYIDKVSSD